MAIATQGDPYNTRGTRTTKKNKKTFSAAMSRKVAPPLLLDRKQQQPSGLLTPESAYATPPSEPFTDAEGVPENPADQKPAAALSPPDDEVPPSVPTASAKGSTSSTAAPAAGVKVPPSVLPRAPAPLAVPRSSVPRPSVPAQAPTRPSPHRHEWRTPAPVLLPPPHPAEQPVEARGGQLAPDGGSSVEIASSAVNERSMEATPTTHRGWKPFIYLYFCVLFVILAILSAYIALAIRQGSEVTVNAADLPSNATSQLYPNITGDVLQRAAQDSMTATEPECTTVVVLAEEEVGTRLEDDEENEDSSKRIHMLKTTTTTTRRGSRGHGRVRGKAVPRRRHRKRVDQLRMNAATST